MTAPQQHETGSDRVDATWPRARRFVKVAAVPLVLVAVLVASGQRDDTAPAPAPTPTTSGAVIVPGVPSAAPTPTPTAPAPVDEPAHDDEPGPHGTAAPPAVLEDLAAASDAAEAALVAWWWATDAETETARTERLSTVLTADATTPSAPELAGAGHYAVEGAVAYLVPLTGGSDDERRYAASVGWVATAWEPGGQMTTLRGDQELTVTVQRQAGGGWLATAITEP